MAPKLSRREWMRLLGAAAATGAAAPGWGASRTSSCVVRPQQTEGPYFLDERLRRADIRTDPIDGSAAEGVPLEVTFQVSQLEDGACRPLQGATVDLWQCDASGAYSGFDDFGGRFDTRGRKFLRGYQVTDERGIARFMTIYPGWYPGRAVHIHFKIRTAPANGRGSEFTSQLYFDEAITDAVHARAPYARHGRRPTTNAEDGIFRRGGRELILPLQRRESGFAGTFEIALRG